MCASAMGTDVGPPTEHNWEVIAAVVILAAVGSIPVPVIMARALLC